MRAISGCDTRHLCFVFRVPRGRFGSARRPRFDQTLSLCDIDVAQLHSATPTNTDIHPHRPTSSFLDPQQIRVSWRAR